MQQATAHHQAGRLAEAICAPRRAHYPVADFDVNADMPFQPNSCFGFFKTDNSFHGIGAFSDEAARRDMLIYNVNVIRQRSSGSLPTVRKQETDLIQVFLFDEVAGGNVAL